MSTTEQLIGRAVLNDIDAILSITTTNSDEPQLGVASSFDSIFTWDYQTARPALAKLYAKSKQSQWDGARDLPWATEVDPEEVAETMIVNNRSALFNSIDYSNSPFRNWGRKEWVAYEVEAQNWALSQFTHGEQGALLCTARVTETVPFLDAKYYAATQVMDEARHVEVFSRYLHEKLNGMYPINAHLRLLLEDILQDSRWDMTYLGMQVMVEGLALAAFSFVHQTTSEPLLKKLLRYVMSDEARHVAFGVMSLQDYYKELSDAEIRERQEFAFEAAVRMRDRFLQQEVWERFGLPVKEVVSIIVNAPERKLFQSILFSKIVPNCKKLGLLDRNDGWLRERFTELGVIHFEDAEDTSTEYDALDEVAKDRAVAAATA